MRLEFNASSSRCPAWLSTPALALDARAERRATRRIPTGARAPSTEYIVTVSGVADNLGNTIPGAYCPFFTTGTQLAPIRNIQPE